MSPFTKSALMARLTKAGHDESVYNRLLQAGNTDRDFEFESNIRNLQPVYGLIESNRWEEANNLLASEGY
jgi:hypothetical protein